MALPGVPRSGGENWCVSTASAAASSERPSRRPWSSGRAGFGIWGPPFRSGSTGTEHYLDYAIPAALIAIVLFTAIFTMMSVIEDRKEDFCCRYLVAPSAAFATL